MFFFKWTTIALLAYIITQNVMFSVFIGFMLSLADTLIESKNVVVVERK